MLIKTAKCNTRSVAALPSQYNFIARYGYSNILLMKVPTNLN